MIIPFPPGGNTDLMGRALQEELRKALNQTVMVINKGGAAGTLGIIDRSCAGAGRLHDRALAQQSAHRAAAYPEAAVRMESFRYICLTYYSPYVLIAGPQAPFKTFQEIIAFAKAKPREPRLRPSRPGSQPHLGMLAVLKAIGADGLGVPFQGAGPMAQALLSGTVMAITETPAVAQASNLTILAALTEERIPALPDVPTMKELGYPAEAFTAGGLIAPADTPPEAVAALEKACAQATATPEYKAIVERLNAEPRYLPGEAFRTMFDADSVRSADAIKGAGLAGNR